MGIEPTQPAWKAGALPLSYTRALLDTWYYIIPEFICQWFLRRRGLNFFCGLLYIAGGCAIILMLQAGILRAEFSCGLKFIKARRRLPLLWGRRGIALKADEK